MPRKFLSEEQKLELRLKDKEARRERRKAPYRQQEQLSSPILHSAHLKKRQVVVISPPRDDLRHRLNQLRSCSPSDEPLDLSRSSTSRTSSSVGNEHPIDLSVPSTSSRIVSFVSSPSKHQVSIFDRLGSIDAPPITPLVSLDCDYEIVRDKAIRGAGPVAWESRLGYLLCGPTGTNQDSSTSVSSLIVNANESFDISRFWMTEALGVIPELTKEEWVKVYKENKISFQDGKYSALLPWKEEHPPLKSNLALCQARTRVMVKRMLLKNPSVMDTYISIIQDQLTRGFIELVKEDSPPKSSLHYICHHPVLKESFTTPVRIVYDCSCRTSDGVSLNDCLEEGPPLQNDMIHLYLRFRMRKIGLMSDIEKAFHMIQLDPTERDFFRFLFPSNPKDPNSSFNTYRFRVFPFGANCSPFVLHAVVQKHLENQNSAVAEELQRNVYVDNLIYGTDDEESAIKFHRESTAILSTGGFNLREWTTNDHAVYNEINKDNPFEERPVIKVLGLVWNRMLDIISFPPFRHPSINKSSVTKRDVASVTHSIFDPLGFLSPVTVRAKILSQQFWIEKYGWDQPLPPSVVDTWINIRQDIERALQFSVDRRYFPSDGPIKVIHVFVDASTKATGFFSNGVKSSLAVAKNKVAPLKKLTLPNLELDAALLGTRLIATVLKALPENHPPVTIRMWSDSQDVHWLISKKKLPVFVSNRVKVINEFANQHQATWSYCPTEDNPADLLTRGIPADHFLSSSLWVSGPSWINEQSSWPQWTPLSALIIAAEPELEEKEVKSTSVDIASLVDRTRFSKLSRLLRATAWILRFIRNCRTSKKKRTFAPLTGSEVLYAQKLWFTSTQKVFKEELQYLSSSTRTGRRPQLVKQLDLIMVDGIIKCGGRLGNADVDEETKHPVLLPKSDYFTRLIIQDIHRRAMHGGVSTTVAALRHSFWIPSARQQVRAVLRGCVICTRLNGRAYVAPDPPSLPKERVWNQPPFTGTGIDLTGALYVRDDAAEKKVYVALFTCTYSRAVHLEVVENLSAAEFVDALRRFANRKSTPRIIFSDNATNFTSSAGIIRQLMESEEVSQFCSSRAIEWRFIIKRAPWYGGFWERLIGLTKSTLKKVIGKRMLSTNELRTIITDVEAALNDRPLTYVSTDRADDEPITPSHLLFGRRIIPFPVEDLPDDINDPSFSPDGESLIQAVQNKTKILHDFWKRWKNEYLSGLREFHQHTTGSWNEVIKIGDVVIVYDEKPRLQWKLAVVESLIRGPDERVRSAVIRTSQGVTNRSIKKLYPLEVKHSMDPAATIEPDVPSDVDDDPGNPTPEQQLPPERQPRRAALAARKRIAGWVRDQEQEDEE